MTQQLELGLGTFGDITTAPDGRLLSHAQVLRNVVAEAVLADACGVDFFGVGEHHRPDFAVSAPEVLLAAIGAQTTTIRLGSAVTVLSSDDPIRVFQRFSTLNATSNGRAEVILGRGSFTESFPLFGFDLAQYEDLFEEKLSLFHALLTEDEVTWQGEMRPPLSKQQVFPKIETGHLKTWVGVGGSQQSVVRAARYDLPLMLAIIGGEPRRFRPFVDLYHRAREHFAGSTTEIGLHSPGYVAATDARARDEFWPGFRDVHARIGAERGWPPMTREHFDRETATGSFYVGAPETVARKIAATVQLLGLSRFDMKYSAGPLSHDKLLRCIELYGREVIPLVREILA